MKSLNRFSAQQPAKLPIKFDLVVNPTTAKAPGLELPPTLSVRADSGDRMRIIPAAGRRLPEARIPTYRPALILRWAPSKPRQIRQ